MDEEDESEFHPQAPLLNDSSSPATKSNIRPKLNRRNSFQNRRKKSLKLGLALILLLCIGLSFLLLLYACPGNICNDDNHHQIKVTEKNHPKFGGNPDYQTHSEVKVNPDENHGENPDDKVITDNELTTNENGVNVGKDPDEVGENPTNMINYEQIQEDNFSFEMNGSDVMVFLHIQKTGGTTFGKHLVQDIDLKEPCQCHRNKKKKKHKKNYQERVKRKTLSCQCLRPHSDKTWLFSRYSTGWKCGLHPDYTELTSCVDDYLLDTEGFEKRRYFYLTFLREPVARYLSEFRHVQRGATWSGSEHWCGGRPATEAEIPPCYQGDDWADVDLKEFMACGSNLAANRQTLMLANLTLVNCYNVSGWELNKRNEVLLRSAKENLLKMAFFGLTEHQSESEFLFQDTFNLRFNVRFNQFDHNQGVKTEESLGDEVIDRIKALNALDLELYEFANRTLHSRIENLREEFVKFTQGVE